MTTVSRTAYSYVRFSSKPQEKGDSVRRQIELSQKYAEQNNLVIDTTLNLHDLGVSAYKGLNATKGALGVFLGAIKSKIVKPDSFLLVESFDRLSRENPLDAFGQFKEIVDSGVTIVTLADDRTYSRALLKKDYSSLGIALNMMTRAHEESQIKGHRVSGAWERKRQNIGVGKKNLTARCPSWLKAKPDNYGFDLIPEKVAVVREILDWTRKGMGQSQIVKILNHRKEKPFGKGNGWQSSSIQKILTNPALYGDFHMGRYENGKQVDSGNICVGYFPALITSEDFYLIQAGRKQRLEPGGRTKKGETVSNLFSGLLKCGYCGGGMTLIGSSAKRRKDEAGEPLPRLGRKAIGCNNGKRGISCWCVQWGYLEFETSFLNFCKDIELAKLVDKLDEDSQSAKLELEERKRALEEEILALVKRASNLSEAIAEMGLSKVLKDSLAKAEIEIAGKQSLLEKLEEDIQTAQAVKVRDSVHAKELKEAITKIGSLPPAELFLFRLSLSEHIRNLIKEITVFPAGQIFTKKQVKTLRSRLQKRGYSKSRVDEYMARYDVKTEPSRVGRGDRGRYAAKDSGRYFKVITKSNNYLAVAPTSHNAAVAEMVYNSAEGGVVRNKPQRETKARVAKTP